MANIWGTIVGVSSWIIGLVIPLILGGNSIICRKAFQLGMAVSVFVFYKNGLAAIALFLAATIAKIDRPPLTLPVFFRVLHLAVLEPFLDQLCSYTGLRYTTASFSSSIAACGPAFTFVAACFCGMEYVQWSARSFRAKVLGMIVMVGGGCIVGFYHGPTISPLHTPTGNQIELDAREIRENWVRGPLLVLVAIVAMVWYNLLIKKVTMQYGSSLWLTIYICAAGTLMTMVAAVAIEGRSPFPWKINRNFILLCYIYSGAVVSGLAGFLQITLTRMRDPVFTASFSPISLVFVIVMGRVALEDIIHLGSILGAACIIVGLFMLLWGKRHDPTPPVLPVQEPAPALSSSVVSLPHPPSPQPQSLQPLASERLERDQSAPERPEAERSELERPAPEQPEVEQSTLEWSEPERPSLEQAERSELERPAPEQPEAELSTSKLSEPERPTPEQPEVEQSTSE